MTVKVIRIIQYEGTEEAVRDAIQKSMSLGVRQCVGYTITIAEHLNELPELIELLPEQVENDLKRASKFSAEFHGISEEPGPFMKALQERENPEKGFHKIPNPLTISTPSTREADLMIEHMAKGIYDTWKHHKNWVPWVNNGNSIKQDEARKCARRAYEEQ